MTYFVNYFTKFNFYKVSKFFFDFLPLRCTVLDEESSSTESR